MERLQGLPAPLLLVGEAGLLATHRKRLSQAWLEAGLEVTLADFGSDSECCQAELDRLLRLATEKKAGTLVGFGGGKCLDMVKWAGLKSGLPVVTLPTSAATAAAATSVVVVHDAQGAVLELVDLPAPPRLCIGDLEFLKSAPPRLLAAGAGDTLAKWLEWAAVEAEPEGAESAIAAFECLKAGPDCGQESAFNACLRLSADASNRGLAPAAAAHSFCAGVSVLPQSRAWLHGEWAGLGLLLQAWLFEDAGLSAPGGLGLKELAGILSLWELPVRIPWTLSESECDQVASRMLAPGETVHALEFASSLSPETIVKGLKALQNQ